MSRADARHIPRTAHPRSPKKPPLAGRFNEALTFEAERTGQGLGVHGAPAGGREHIKIICRADEVIE